MPACARQAEIAICGKRLVCFSRFSLSSSTAATTTPSLSRTAAASCHQIGSNLIGSWARKGEPLRPKTNNATPSFAGCAGKKEEGILQQVAATRQVECLDP